MSLIGNVLISFLASLFCVFQWGFSWPESISLGLTLSGINNFVAHLGKRILILELMMVLAAVQWLLSAVITYEVFNKHNELAFLWKTFMTISTDEYFAFVLPGTLMLYLGLTFPVNRHPLPTHAAIVERTRHYLADKGNIGLWMSLIGASVFFFIPYLPTLIRGTFAFFSQLLYVGVFYVLFSPKSRHKGLILAAVLSIMFLNAAMTGMYGEIVFWSVMYLIMHFMQYPAPLSKKIAVFAFGLMGILLIQSIKHEYRKSTWDEGMVRNTDFGLFFGLIADRISNPAKMMDNKSMFEISSRANQGLLIASVMNYVPKREPYANGETIATSVAAAVVPRIIWPNKPQAGGKENVMRFLGADDVEYSFNLSPLGEAYVNFGKTGAIIYIFFYGLVFNWAFRYCLYLSATYPSLIAWLPLLFVGSVGAETDLLTTLGSLIKAGMFTAFIFWFCRIMRVKI